MRTCGDTQPGRQGFLVAAETVVQDRRGPIEHRESDAFAASGHGRASAFDEIARLSLATTVGSETDGAIRSQVAPRRVGGPLDLLDE